MDPVTRVKQRRIIKRTQQRLNRLMEILSRLHLSKRSSQVDSEALQEFVRRSLAAQMFNTGFSSGPFGITTSPALQETPTVTLEPETEMELTNMCLDIRGRDRTCCNAALRCFDDVKSAIDELDNAPPGTFTILTACRKVGSELKRDKLCVQQSLSRCSGQDRPLLQRRFDSRIGTLYDQYYKHCRPSSLTTSTTPVPTNNTTPIPPASTDAVTKVWPTFRTETDAPTGKIPSFPPEFPDSSGHGHPFPPNEPHDHDGHTHKPPGELVNSSGALIAGVVTGGIILALILVIAVLLWCKNRRDNNGSNGSMDSQMGIFFHKRSLSPDRAGQHNNNNKPPAMRQDSDVYAEIDENMVNPGFKPPVPSSLTLPVYLNPVSDDDSSSYTPPPSNRSTSVPAFTTRGQMSYGAILAANQEAEDHVVPYHSTTLTFPDDHGKKTKKELKQEKVPLPPRNLPGESNHEFQRATSIGEFSDDGLDEYEQPISACSSLRYATIDNSEPPKHFAPAVPTVPETETVSTSPEVSGPKKTGGVKVLPSNPFSPLKTTVNVSSSSASQPKPQPRRKKEAKKSTSGSPETEKVKRADVSSAANRDSHISNTSTKSSHHYFVLEPEHMPEPGEYENSVSSSRIV